MNLRDQRKEHYVSVKKLTTVWNGAGMKGATKLLMDPASIIEPDSWVSEIKRLIEEKQDEFYINAQIELVANFFNKNNYDETQKEGGGTSITTEKSEEGTPQDKDDNTDSIPGRSRDTRSPFHRFDPRDL